MIQLSHLSSLLFSIPAVKSVAFGNDKISGNYLVVEANDCYYYQDGTSSKKLTSNNNGAGLLVEFLMECQSFLQLESNKPFTFYFKEQKRLTKT